jgi:hypothetical protein
MEEMEVGESDADVERAELLPEHEVKVAEPEKKSGMSALIWIVINTLATIGIVSSSWCIDGGEWEWG